MEELKTTVFTFFRSTTGRLTLTYLAVIMVMSFSFTIVLYGVSTAHLDRRLPESTQSDAYGNIFRNQSLLQSRIEAFLQRRVDQEKAELAWQLFIINILVACGGAMVSYILARKTLEPIEQAMASKDQFISDASHELRTPLTALQTSNEVALRKPKMSLNEATELLAHNLDEVKRLQYLTDALLRLLQENSTPAKKKTVQLQDVVSESLNQVVGKAQAKDISVEDTVPKIELRTDPALLSQLMTIFIDNAIKYSPAKSAVTISAVKRKKVTKITIEDQGVGVKKAELDHIFERFYRVDQARNKQTAEGYGLGLAIAKKIAGSIDADISVKSIPKKGSQFIITIFS